MVGPSGLEPPTSRLSGVRSNQLSYGPLERVKGIEPSRPAWKAGVLPLNYTRMNVVGKTGFEPATLWSQTRCATKLRYFPTWRARRDSNSQPSDS